jgi:N-acetylmuramoyl-L-alanine amidase
MLAPLLAAATLALTPAAAAPKPKISYDPIPFGAKRIAETRAYAERHYGLHRARLIDPKVIVIHVTASSTYSSVFNTFADDVADVELKELPQVCSHFVIDKDGTIHELVPLKWMCRHTVGLNWTAIGIEHVGMTDGQVLGDKAQLQASLKLVRWLQGRYGIATKNVIGHNESLSSPYHHEKVVALRKQTHGDMTHASMQVYRRDLAGG